MAFLTVWLIAYACLAAIGWKLARRRSLILALVVFAFMTWLGQQGGLSYLGVNQPSRESAMGPVVAASTALLLSLMLRPKPRQRLEAHTSRLERSRYLPEVVAFAGVVLMARRFSVYGIPLLSGNRFATVQSVSALEALATAVSLVLGAALLAARPGRLKLVPVVLLGAVLAVTTLNSSRLLLVAIVVAVVAGRRSAGALPFRLGTVVRVGAILFVLVGVLLPMLYSMRAADTASTRALESRAEAGAQDARWIVDLLGASTYISARNGASVSTRVLEADAGPPSGFVVSAVTYALGVVPGMPGGVDPEIYLTENFFGLDKKEVGATAIPVASAVQADYGLWGCAVYGAVIVAGYGVVGRRGSVAAAWWAFGVAFSAYGMYLLSVQFLAVLAAFVAVGFDRIESRQSGEAE